MTVTESTGRHIPGSMDVANTGCKSELKKVRAISGSLSSGQQGLFELPVAPKVEVRLGEASTQKAIRVIS